MTNSDFHVAGYGCPSSCREYTHPRNDDRSQPKGFNRGNTRIGPVLEVKITKQFDCRGIEIKIDSLRKDGTQSWMAISSGVDKYVTELFEESRKTILFEAASPSTGQLVAMQQRQQLNRLHLRH